MTSPDDQDPLFSIVKGSPTEEELVAVMTVLSAQFGQPRQEEETTPVRSGWSAYWRTVRSPIQPSPSAWRMSARPQ
jgi:hypothetical protein